VICFDGRPRQRIQYAAGIGLVCSYPPEVLAKNLAFQQKHFEDSAANL